MKRYTHILLATFLAFGISSTVFAQSDNAAATASATVEAPITVSADQNIDYGTLTTGTDNGANAPATPGRFTVSATSTASVGLSFAKTDLTTASAGTDQTLVLTLGTAGTEDAVWEDDPSANYATAVGAGTVFFAGTGANATLPADGDIAVWVNPIVTVDGTEVPGSYSGSVTLTATYN